MPIEVHFIDQDNGIFTTIPKRARMPMSPGKEGRRGISPCQRKRQSRQRGSVVRDDSRLLYRVELDDESQMISAMAMTSKARRIEATDS